MVQMLHSIEHAHPKNGSDPFLKFVERIMLAAILLFRGVIRLQIFLERLSICNLLAYQGSCFQRLLS